MPEPQIFYKKGGIMNSLKSKIMILMLVLFVSSFSFIDKVFGDTFDFPSADSTLTTPVFGRFDPDTGDVGFFAAGISLGETSLSETFTSTCDSIEAVNLNIEVVENTLNPRINPVVNWDLIINTSVVGSFSVNPLFTGPISISPAISPPINGPIYDVKLLVTQGVPRGLGDHTLAYTDTVDQTFAHSIEFICAADSDSDGVPDDVDVCMDTAIPEGVPTRTLRTNRFALVDGDDMFDTISPKGKGPEKSYTIEDTAGCSCEQIIDQLGLGKGHSKHGCSISAMEEWVLSVNQ